MHQKLTTGLSVAVLFAIGTSALADDPLRRQLQCVTLLSIDQGTAMTLPIGNAQFEQVTVTLNGLDYASVYEADGLEHRWHINPEEGEDQSDHQVILKADLTAGYFDFTGLEAGEEREAETVFFCRFPGESESASDGQGNRNFEASRDPGVPDTGPDSTNIADTDYRQILRVEPVYPARALARGLEGYVDLEFTITSAGTVRDPVVIRSTSSMFENAAIRSVVKYQYEPRVANGIPVDVPGVRTRVEFRIEH